MRCNMLVLMLLGGRKMGGAAKVVGPLTYI